MFTMYCVHAQFVCIGFVPYVLILSNVKTVGCLYELSQTINIL